MTAQAAKAAILRTKKLNGGAAYIWGAVKSIDTPSQYTLVFHLSYPSPLDLEASADYSAYIYDTQAAGSGSLTKWLNTPHDAGTGPYTLQTWNNGQEFEVILKAFRGTGAAGAASTTRRSCSAWCRRTPPRPSCCASGQVSFVEQMSPTQWKSLQGVAGIKLVSSPSWQNLLAQLNTPALPRAGPAGDLLRHRLPGHRRRAERRGGAVERDRARGPASATSPTCRATPTTRPRQPSC